jgi:hypothetical protein
VAIEPSMVSTAPSLKMVSAVAAGAPPEPLDPPHPEATTVRVMVGMRKRAATNNDEIHTQIGLWRCPGAIV